MNIAIPFFPFLLLSLSHTLFVFPIKLFVQEKESFYFFLQKKEERKEKRSLLSKKREREREREKINGKRDPTLPSSRVK